MGLWLAGAGAHCLGRHWALGTGRGDPSRGMVTLTTSSTCAVCRDTITSLWVMAQARRLMPTAQSLRAVYCNCPLVLLHSSHPFPPQEREERAQT